MSDFLHLCDCSVPYCASLEAWNWVGAGQHLDAIHPRSSDWPIPNVSFFRQLFLEKLKTVITPQPLARPDYQLSSGIKYTIWLHNHSHPQSNAINYKFMTWIGSLFCLQTSYHMWTPPYFETNHAILTSLSNTVIKYHAQSA